MADLDTQKKLDKLSEQHNLLQYTRSASPLSNEMIKDIKNITNKKIFRGFFQ